jgi:hypothetical protein
MDLQCNKWLLLEIDIPQRNCNTEFLSVELFYWRYREQGLPPFDENRGVSVG